MRSGGNRNSVTLSRMIKARFSRFVCPVATYVSYFSFTSCQCSGVLFLHDAQRSAAMRRAGLLPGNVLLETLISRIRNLSTEDGFPAWRIADVGNWLYSIFYVWQYIFF